jgi:hypothetical protein
VTNGKKILLVATKILLVAMKGVAVTLSDGKFMVSVCEEETCPLNDLIITAILSWGAGLRPFLQTFLLRV